MPVRPAVAPVSAPRSPRPRSPPSSDRRCRARQRQVPPPARAPVGCRSTRQSVPRRCTPPSSDVARQRVSRQRPAPTLPPPHPSSVRDPDRRRTSAARWPAACRRCPSSRVRRPPSPITPRPPTTTQATTRITPDQRPNIGQSQPPRQRARSRLRRPRPPASSGPNRPGGDRDRPAELCLGARDERERTGAPAARRGPPAATDGRPGFIAWRRRIRARERRRCQLDRGDAIRRGRCRSARPLGDVPALAPALDGCSCRAIRVRHQVQERPAACRRPRRCRRAAA